MGMLKFHMPCSQKNQNINRSIHGPTLPSHWQLSQLSPGYTVPRAQAYMRSEVRPQGSGAWRHALMSEKGKSDASALFSPIVHTMWNLSSLTRGRTTPAASLHWECRILTTGPPGNSDSSAFNPQTSGNFKTHRTSGVSWGLRGPTWF